MIIGYVENGEVRIYKDIDEVMAGNGNDLPNLEQGPELAGARVLN